jgi:hypothetical protein
MVGRMGFRKVWLVSLAVVLAGLAVVVLGVHAWVRAFLRSDQFRELVAAKVGDLWQVDGTFSPLRWQGWTVYADTYQATGRAGGAVKNLRAQRIRADLAWRELLRGTWHLRSVQIGALELMTVPVGSGRDKAPVAEPPQAPLPGWVPQKFRLERAEVENTIWDFPGGSVRGASVRLFPESNGWFLEAERGSLRLPQLPANELAFVQLRWFPTGWFLTRARLDFRDGGFVEASGELGAEKWSLKTNWRELPSEQWLPSRMREHLRGRWSIEAASEGKVGEPLSASRTVGAFSLQDGEIRNLPLFQTIGTFIRSRQFERVPLQEFSGQFEHSGTGTDFSGVVLESRGLVRMTGEVFVGPEGELRGDLRAGLTPQTLQWMPGSRERVFTERDGGYLWTDVELGGTLDQPTENLSRRLLVAGGEEVIESGARTIRESTETAVEGVRSVLDALLPLVP